MLTVLLFLCFHSCVVGTYRSQTLSKPLSIDTYLEVMSALLHVEEVQMEVVIVSFIVYAVTNVLSHR